MLSSFVFPVVCTLITGIFAAVVVIAVAIVVVVAVVIVVVVIAVCLLFACCCCWWWCLDASCLMLWTIVVATGLCCGF